MTFSDPNPANSVRSKAMKVLSATRQHATNLATFALLYKTLTILSRRKPGLVPHVPDALKYSPENLAHAAPSYTPSLAGCIAGYLVFGRHPSASAVNQQIVIYVFARVCLALARLVILAPQPGPQGFQAGYEGIGLAGGMGGWIDTLCKGDKDMAEMWRKRIRKNTWPVFASLSWGAVMWLFTWYPDLLQPSMRSSMKFLYVDSERWEGWKTWILRNE